MREKKIGLWKGVSIGVGGMIGAGIFSIVGTACQISGNAVYVSFIIAGLVALFSTYSYAKLGSTFPSAGGPVEFLVQSFGSGILSGGINILLWLGYIVALALYARAFAAYAMTFFPDAPGYLNNIFITGIILLFVLVNFIGANAVASSEFFVVFVKVVILIFFAAIGFVYIKPEYLSLQKFPPVNSIFYGAAVVFLAYEGFGLITNAAEDMENPRKTLPRALYLSVLIVIAIYAAVSLVVVGNLPLPEIVKAEDYALAEAAKPILGMLGFKLVAIAALFSTASAINATLYGGANVCYMIARDGELPELFERKIWRHGTEGLVITALLVIILANFLDLSKIAMLGSAIFLIVYGGVNVGHLLVRDKTGGSLSLILLAIAGNFISFAILFYYLLEHSSLTLVVLAIIIAFSFLLEWFYSAVKKRDLKSRII